MLDSARHAWKTSEAIRKRPREKQEREKSRCHDRYLTAECWAQKSHLYLERRPGWEKRNQWMAVLSPSDILLVCNQHRRSGVGRGIGRVYKIATRRGKNCSRRKWTGKEIQDFYFVDGFFKRSSLPRACWNLLRIDGGGRQGYSGRHKHLLLPQRRKGPSLSSKEGFRCQSELSPRKGKGWGSVSAKDSRGGTSGTRVANGVKNQNN